ncbi:MAG TPA: ABC transporter ATP-binding protein [Thermoanaerobaculia bacterium]|nr:ABC transporter ATP-binding protein [Thermoanaerobaculia bacterium]
MRGPTVDPLERSAAGPSSKSVPGSEPLLQVEDLQVVFPGERGEVAVVDRLGFEMRRGELLGLVGESGAGKSLTALALLRLVPPPGRITGGRVRLGGQDLLDLPESTMRSVRGGRIAMVFQEPQAALNPVFTVGAQIVETIRAHRQVSRREAKAEALRLLELVAMPDPAQRLRSYPHQLSGGQRQRAMLAVALAGEPELLVADEPTTALDVTIQAQILDLLQRLRRELGLSVLLITHDLAVVAETCDRVCVLYAGRLVEEAPVEELFRVPAHPYTRGLMRALPRLGAPAPRGAMPSISGRVPEPGDRWRLCAFRARCGEALARCAEEPPTLRWTAAGHRARCLLVPEATSQLGPATDR